MNNVIRGWAVKWRSGPNNVDNKVNEHLLYGANWAGEKDCHHRHPVFFKSRKAARDWAREHYGYIARRADLRTYPHDWKPPIVVRATLVVQEIVSVEPKRPRRQRRGSSPAKRSSRRRAGSGRGIHG